MQPLRSPPGPRLRRRTSAHGPSLLHQLSCSEIEEGLISQFATIRPQAARRRPSPLPDRFLAATPQATKPSARSDSGKCSKRFPPHRAHKILAGARLDVRPDLRSTAAAAPSIAPVNGPEDLRSQAV